METLKSFTSNNFRDPVTAIIDDFRNGWNVVFSPGANTSKKMSIGDAFAFYYKFSVIPIILLIAMLYVLLSIAMAIFSQVPTIGHTLSLIGNLGVFGVIVFAVLWLWIAVPIAILIQAALYQLVGGALMGKFKGGYSGTVTACIYAAFPSVMIAWLGFIPVLGGLLSFLFGIYSIYILVTALANQHKTTKGTAFLVWLVWVLIGVIIVVALVFFIVAMFGGAILHSLGGTTGTAMP
jgi:hypothetical protein